VLFVAASKISNCAGLMRGRRGLTTYATRISIVPDGNLGSGTTLDAAPAKFHAREITNTAKTLRTEKRI